MEGIPITDLDELVLSCVAAKLDARSLAKLACTCKQLERTAGNQHLWEKLCCERWKRRSTSLWKSFSLTGDYKALYARKHQARLGETTSRPTLDQTSLQLADSLASKETAQPALLLKLYHLGAETDEALAAEEISSVRERRRSRRWRIRSAMTHVQGRRAAEQLRRLSELPPQESLLDEGSMLLAQAYYPMSDLSAIPRFFDELAVELRARMAAAGVTGGVKALELLSRLLFASPEAEEAEEEFNGYPVARCWGPKEEAALIVPKDGESLGLQGNRDDYYAVANSLLPDVLTTKKGIPITLCVIHAAVGRRAGLNIGGANRPYHFVNSFVDGDFISHIDCFAGGSIQTEQRRMPGNSESEAAIFPLHYCPPNDVWTRCITNLQVLYDNMHEEDAAGMDVHSQMQLRDDQDQINILALLSCIIPRNDHRRQRSMLVSRAMTYVSSTWPDPVAVLEAVLQ